MRKIEPMKAKKTEEEKYVDSIYEPKYDGGRIIAIKKNGKIHLHTKTQFVGERFPIIREQLELPENTIIDGEMVVFKEGISNFSNYQSRVNTKNSMKIDMLSKTLKVKYMVFDILKLEDENLMNKELMERKKVLEENLEDTDQIKKVKYYNSKGKLLNNTREREGIMIKKKNSKYREGKRSDSWKKLKFVNEEDYTVYGYTSKDRDVSALIIGKDEKFIGRVNMAMPNNAYEIWKGRLEATRTKEQTIEIPIDIKENVFYVEPEFKAKVRFLEKTQNGLRFPVLKDLEVIR